MKGISVAEEWLASEEGVCSMGFVVYLFWASDYVLLSVLMAVIYNWKDWHHFDIHFQYDDQVCCSGVVMPINSFLAVCYGMSCKHLFLLRKESRPENLQIVYFASWLPTFFSEKAPVHHLLTGYCTYTLKYISLPPLLLYSQYNSCGR
jgi:hypothetical protein